MEFPTPHGDKLKALLENGKLPEKDLERARVAQQKYQLWRKTLIEMDKEGNELTESSVNLLNEYRKFIDLDLIFGSEDDFLYRQKGQLKLDNTVLEEFIPILIGKYFLQHITEHNLKLGPTTCFSSIRFEGEIKTDIQGAGIKVKEKNQDFAISKDLYIKTSHNSDFSNALTVNTTAAFFAAECKTNLDKTMFQEAASTALDLKLAVPASRYFLLCEWLDMTPISTSSTAIDEILILRKAKRLSSNIRGEFNTVKGREKWREYYEKFLTENPFSTECFKRVVNHVNRLFADEEESIVVKRGYF